LASRFTGKAAAAQTHVTAKTGWIEGVYALAGRIDSIDGTPLDFVVVASGEGLTSTSMEAIDILVNGFYGCGNNLASY
jgi:D-alanyl-D-alanine carboxypeptidase/D-alanyl-D-alanine-endopeptidase (penicillin-binding protein 4)